MSYLDDVISTSVIVDNVMIDKSIADKLQNNRRINSINGGMFSDTFGVPSRSQSYDNGNDYVFFYLKILSLY